MDKILLGHGSGGRLSHALIRENILHYLGNPTLNQLGDAALLKLDKGNYAFTTDSYVVKPLFFPGGDIGKLAVYGTVNDLSVMGAKPLYISLAFILEEGLGLEVFRKVLQSIKEAAEICKVKVVTGDTKVVERGASDGMFINTSGIGKLMFRGRRTEDSGRIKVGDSIIVSGDIADHGIAVLIAREEFGIKSHIKSDCAPLWDMISKLQKYDTSIRFMRDPTRGGVASTLNEVVGGKDYGVELFEAKIPIKEDVRGACELLGFDPLYVANEGKVVIIVHKSVSAQVLKEIKKHLLGAKADIIGEVTASNKGKVTLRTMVGGSRIVDMLSGEQLPRIC
ncbi:MAG: hydrogenase expression/formation protein HypE [bacterium]